MGRVVQTLVKAFAEKKWKLAIKALETAAANLKRVAAQEWGMAMDAKAQAEMDGETGLWNTFFTTEAFAFARRAVTKWVCAYSCQLLAWFMRLGIGDFERES